MHRPVGTSLGVAIIIIVAAFFGALVWQSDREEASDYDTGQQVHRPRQIACTEEAMICPDGSAVGRTGPNCEFSPCPNGDGGNISDWQTYRNEKYGFGVKYPDRYCVLGQDRGERGIIFESYRDGKCPKMEDRGELGTLTLKYSFDVFEVIPFAGSIDGYIEETRGGEFDKKRMKPVVISNKSWTVISSECDYGCSYKKELIFKNDKNGVIYSIKSNDEGVAVGIAQGIALLR